LYIGAVPRLWDETIETHRRAVHEAIVAATAALVTKHGLASVTMSQIATEAGIGRATLYKYFPDVESILIAWHEHQVATHLRQLAEVRDRTGDLAERLHAVLEAFALISYERHGTELAALLHRGEHVIQAQRQLHGFIQALIAEGATADALRGDISPEELASYCLHALTAASSLPSKDAVYRLVHVTLARLLPRA
jgi:AcrR family transcriptional regulator